MIELHKAYILSTEIPGLSKWVTDYMERYPGSIELEIVKPTYSTITFKDTKQEFCTKSGYALMTVIDEAALIVLKLKFGL